MEEIFSVFKWEFINFLIKEKYFYWFIKFGMTKFLLSLLIKIIIFNLLEFILVRKYFVSIINYFGKFLLKCKNLFLKFEILILGVKYLFEWFMKFLKWLE